MRWVRRRGDTQARRGRRWEFRRGADEWANGGASHEQRTWQAAEYRVLGSSNTVVGATALHASELDRFWTRSPSSSRAFERLRGWLIGGLGACVLHYYLGPSVDYVGVQMAQCAQAGGLAPTKGMHCARRCTLRPGLRARHRTPVSTGPRRACAIHCA